MPIPTYAGLSADGEDENTTTLSTTTVTTTPATSTMSLTTTITPTTSPQQSITFIPTTDPFSTFPTTPLESYLVEVIMTISPWPSDLEIPEEDVIGWELNTSDYIQQEISPNSYCGATVSTNIVGQLLPGTVPKLTESLIILFEVQVLYEKRDILSETIPFYIYSAFAWEECKRKGEEFIGRLPPTFDGIKEIRLLRDYPLYS